MHLPFNFQLIELPWHARAIWPTRSTATKRRFRSYGWPNWVLGNHDNPRIASRIGPDQAATSPPMLLLTLRGTPTLYYGDEIGMHNVPIPPDRVQDPFEKNVPGLGLGRDPAPRRCSGRPPTMPASRPPRPGCQSPTTCERHQCPAQKAIRGFNMLSLMPPADPTAAT